MSVWGLALLVAKGCIRLDRATESWAQTHIRFQMLGLNVCVALEANALPGDFHPDPADRLIVATARHHELTLITEDQQILDYGAQGYLRAHPSSDKELTP